MIATESYESQNASWPKSGRHILAQFDATNIVVYQAYRPSIAEAAIEDGRLGGGGWSRNRMSWIKPNFLWMMFRSGWATKEGQERILAIRISRAGFDSILSTAVHSTYVPDVYGTREAWQDAIQRSDVRLQWDPDHGPGGAPLERRAIQLGLKGGALSRFVDEWTVSIEDITGFVQAQHSIVRSGNPKTLETPKEDKYPVRDAETARRLGVTT